MNEQHGPIMWQKWKNPIRIPIDDNELSPSEIETKDSFQNSDDNNTVKIHNKFIGAMYIGALGIIPIWSSCQADDLFNFWEGHTSFPILKYHKNLIQSVLGVEEFTLLTPYRFRIAIAKHPNFQPSIVKQNIEKLFIKTNE